MRIFIPLTESYRFRTLSTNTRGHCSTSASHRPASSLLTGWSAPVPASARVGGPAVHGMCPSFVPDRLGSPNRHRRSQAKARHCGIRPHRGRWRWCPPHVPIPARASAGLRASRVGHGWYIGCLGETGASWRRREFVGPATACSIRTTVEVREACGCVRWVLWRRGMIRRTKLNIVTTKYWHIQLGTLQGCGAVQFWDGSSSISGKLSRLDPTPAAGWDEKGWG